LAEGYTVAAWASCSILRTLNLSHTDTGLHHPKGMCNGREEVGP